MKIFAISDVHGHYEEMRDALYKHKFDENDENHLLVVCGDLFDRGDESLEVYHYLKSLTDKKRAIVLRGNHEPFFINWLKGNNTPFNYLRNGMSHTIDSFLERTNAFMSYCFIDKECEPSQSAFEDFSEIARKEILEHEPELLEWLENLPYYYETEHFIFTHASIDIAEDDWRYPCKRYYNFSGWEACTWDDGSFFGKEIRNTDKKIVIGHFDSGHLREMYGIGSRDDHSILYRRDGKVIALDACTILTKEINVLVMYEEKI